MTQSEVQTLMDTASALRVDDEMTEVNLQGATVQLDNPPLTIPPGVILFHGVFIYGTGRISIGKCENKVGWI